MARMAYQFIHGGIMRLKHWGRMIIHSVCMRVKASDSADSHCPEGREMTAPRTTSEMFAITGREKPITALSQSGIGMMVLPMRISKGISSMIVKSSTSHGEFRKNCVASQEPPRTGASKEICMSPRAAPVTVPSAMARKLMMMLSANPCH